MEKEYSYIDSLKAHRDASNKFDYFILAVILALLSLSIQTFNPDTEIVCVYLIYVFWFLLLISLLSGFYRQERNILFLADETDKIYAIQYQNKTEDSKHVKGANESLKKNERKALISYHIQRWTFVLALIIYIIFKIVNYEN